MNDMTVETAGKMLDIICDRIQEIDEMVVRVKHSSHITINSNIEKYKKQELFNEYNLLMLDLYNELHKLQEAHEILINFIKAKNDSVC